MHQFGPFRIERVIGRGGMGAVYKGIHVDTGEVAAVKVLLSTQGELEELEEDGELRLRFKAEIDTLRRLRHPNIVRLYGFSEGNGALYYVMEMVDGPSLHQELKKRRVFDWPEAAKIGLEMCSALKHGHDRGITHRDIKPANILLERQGTTKLSDYGIAQLFGGSHLTNANAVVGTLEYMSPEQALANPVGPRSDLYSLGAVLYAILVGRPPFTAKSLSEVLRKHQNNTPDPIRAARLDIPDELEAIILDLLKIKQEDRPSNAYMAGKRFQSLLQALVGPPEKILVKPMSDDAIPIPSLGPLSIPTDRPQEKIAPARGFVTDGGIIDLGGIVWDKENPSPTEANELLEQSFGSLREGGQIPDAKEVERTEESLPPAKSISWKPSPPTIRHGEISLEMSTGIRRTKDEPLPYLENFEALRREITEQGDAEQDQVTKWTDRQSPVPPLIDEVQQPVATPTGISKAPFLEGPPEQSVEKNADVSAGQPFETDRSKAGESGKGSLSGTRFVAVSEEDLGGFDETPRSKQHVMSLQTILTSICLVLIGLLIYYLLQPVPAEKLFTRIKNTIQEDDSGEFSASSLRQAERDIESFLSMYSHHPKADIVRDFKEELELANKEQGLRRRQTFANPASRDLAEWAYFEAVSHSRTDPEKEILKLRAIVDLFGTDVPRIRNDRSVNRRLATETQICVELARRRLNKLEAEFATIQKDTLAKLKTRLDDADNLQAENPERAAEIRRGLIELYQDRPWAAEYVERAKKP